MCRLSSWSSSYLGQNQTRARGGCRVVALHRRPHTFDQAQCRHLDQTDRPLCVFLVLPSCPFARGVSGHAHLAWSRVLSTVTMGSMASPFFILNRARPIAMFCARRPSTICGATWGVFIIMKMIDVDHHDVMRFNSICKKKHERKEYAYGTGN